MSRRPRPVYLDPLRIHLPLPGWVSILHRVSGVLLFMAFPIAVWALSVSLSNEAGFRRVATAVGHPAVRTGALVLVWALSHHFFAGLRHLALDVQLGSELKAARRSSAAVFVASALLTLIAAWELFQ